MASTRRTSRRRSGGRKRDQPPINPSTHSSQVSDYSGDDESYADQQDYCSDSYSEDGDGYDYHPNYNEDEDYFRTDEDYFSSPSNSSQSSMSPERRADLLGPTDEEIWLLERGMHPSQVDRRRERAGRNVGGVRSGEQATTARAPRVSIESTGEAETAAQVETESTLEVTVGAGAEESTEQPAIALVNNTAAANAPIQAAAAQVEVIAPMPLTDLQVINIPQKPVVSALPKINADLKKKTSDKISVPKSLSSLKKGSKAKTEGINAINKGRDYLKEWAEFATDLSEKATVAVKTYENGISDAWKAMRDQGRAITALNKEIRAANTRVTTLNATIRDLKRDVTDLQGKLAEAEKSNKSLKTELKKANDETDKLRGSAKSGGGKKGSSTAVDFEERLLFQKRSNDLKLQFEVAKHKQQEHARDKVAKNKFKLRNEIMGGLQDGSFRSHLGGVPGGGGGLLEQLGLDNTCYESRRSSHRDRGYSRGRSRSMETERSRSRRRSYSRSRSRDRSRDRDHSRDSRRRRRAGSSRRSRSRESRRRIRDEPPRRSGSRGNDSRSGRGRSKHRETRASDSRRDCSRRRDSREDKDASREHSRGVNSRRVSNSLEERNEANNLGNNESTMPPAVLPPNWTAHSCPNTGKTYYANCTTRETTWDLPTAQPQPPAPMIGQQEVNTDNRSPLPAAYTFDTEEVPPPGHTSLFGSGSVMNQTHGESHLVTTQNDNDDAVTALLMMGNRG